jgi:hypothetical protein
MISALGNISVIQTTPSRACRSSAISAATSALISGGVRGAPHTDELDLRRQLGRRTQQVGQPLLTSDPAHEDD